MPTRHEMLWPHGAGHVARHHRVAHGRPGSARRQTCQTPILPTSSGLKGPVPCRPVRRTLRGVMLSEELRVADIEGYSQPRRPFVFAQVRDRLPRPVNKPHCLCAHLLRVGERCPFARRRLRSPQWVPRGPPFGFAPAERAQAPLLRLREVRAHPVARSLAGSIDDARGRLRRVGPHWAGTVRPHCAIVTAPNRSAHLPGCIPSRQVWTEQARRCPPLRRRGATRPVCRHEIRGIIRFSPQSQDRGMALAANVDIPTNLGIRAAPSEQN